MCCCCASLCSSYLVSSAFNCGKAFYDNGACFSYPIMWQLPSKSIHFNFIHCLRPVWRKKVIHNSIFEQKNKPFTKHISINKNDQQHKNNNKKKKNIVQKIIIQQHLRFFYVQFIHLSFRLSIHIYINMLDHYYT